VARAAEAYVQGKKSSRNCEDSTKGNVVAGEWADPATSGNNGGGAGCVGVRLGWTSKGGNAEEQFWEKKFKRVGEKKKHP